MRARGRHTKEPNKPLVNVVCSVCRNLCRKRVMTTSPKALVERFYFEVWNRADEQVAREILHPDFRFRGSLGSVRRGPDGFIDYMRSIHAALADYTCTIEDLIATKTRAAARMTFKG